MTSRTAANRYARALFDVALNEKVNLDEIEAQLAGFVDLFARYPLLEKVLLNPAVPVPRKRAAVSRLLTSARARGAGGGEAAPAARGARSPGAPAGFARSVSRARCSLIGTSCAPR